MKTAKPPRDPLLSPDQIGIPREMTDKDGSTLKAWQFCKPLIAPDLIALSKAALVTLGIGII